MQEHIGLAFLIRLGKFLSAILIVIIIVTLASGNPNTPEIIVLSVFAVLEAWNVRTIILILFLIAISPILCFLFCFFVCCEKCRDNEEARNFKPPEAKQATLDMIEKTDGSCPICFQTFVPK